MTSNHLISSLAFSCLIIITYTSCKKASPDERGYVKITAGMMTFNFSADVIASPVNASGKKGFRMITHNAPGSKSYFEIILTMSGNTGPFPALYTENDSSDPMIEITWHWGGDYLDGSHVTYIAHKNPYQPVRIHINKLNAEGVTGTLTGTLQDATSKSKFPITNGEFYAKF